jgi:hypothetical protein
VLGSVAVDVESANGAAMVRNENEYRVSSYCSAGSCVGVLPTAEGVEVVDVGNESAGRLVVSRASWVDFVAGVKAGEFDLPAGG